MDGADHRSIEAALQQLRQAWGAPHAHAGLSIGRLTGHYFECRAGPGLRVVFRAGADGLDLVMAGSHDEVRRLLRDD